MFVTKLIELTRLLELIELLKVNGVNVKCKMVTDLRKSDEADHDDIDGKRARFTRRRSRRDARRPNEDDHGGRTERAGNRHRR